MNELFKRIAIHGGLAAVLLGVIGYIYAEVASAVLVTAVGPNRAPNGNTAETMKQIDPDDSLHRRVPMMMAIWGFVVITCIELVKHLWRRGKKPVTQPPPPDEAERLLNELLQQVEAAEKAKKEASSKPGEQNRASPPAGS